MRKWWTLVFLTHMVIGDQRALSTHFLANDDIEAGRKAEAWAYAHDWIPNRKSVLIPTTHDGTTQAVYGAVCKGNLGGGIPQPILKI